ncbi:MAG: hypothetical protein KIT09_14615 [Bryobacteraceae bacterium]|nr:hypothetical protein [Bryobacteraceae bacterium]
MFARTAAVALLGPLLAPAADLRTACADPPRYHSERIEGRHAYTIRMGGRIDGEMTRDPVGYWAFDQYWEPNLYVRLENAGEAPVVNPWLRRADKPDTRSVKAIVDHLVKPSMSDGEKARRLWEFEIKNRFHATSNDEEVDDAIKRFNVYGYTLCGNESKVMSDLWRAAGLRVRRGFPNGHSTAEVFFDGGWRLLDSDESIVCLLRDNKTIASEEQIVRDHDLMKRTHTYGPLHDDNRQRDEGSAALHYYEGERSGEQPSLTRHRMDLVLRPGEAITWAWNPGGRFHGRPDAHLEAIWNKRWRLIAHAMNGELSYSPDLGRAAELAALEKGNVAAREGPFGAGVYLDGKAGFLTVPVKSPYPVVGGRLEVDFARRETRAEQLKASLSFDGGATWREAWTSEPSDYRRMYIDLDEFFPATDPARYEYLVRFDLTSAAGAPVVCLKGFLLRSTLQMARLSLPGVSLGENEFVYSDENQAGRKVRITHAWRECGSAEVPAAPGSAVEPPDGGVAGGAVITFRWAPVAGEDYEFQLSEYADMRWTLSPNFRKLISRTANRSSASYTLPYKGLLNPDATYHWRVRARSAEGVWGPWSKTYSFRVSAPAVPVNVAARFDALSRKAALSWEPGDSTVKPARFRVYGSAERGFSASDAPFVYFAGMDGMKNAPPNLLLETAAPVHSVDLPANLWRAYYRVAAVDAEGRESGPSDQAELAHPLIVTGSLPEGRAAAFYQARVDASRSIGHLTSADENGKAYQMKFRGGDELEFEMSGGPRGVEIDRKTGVISGFLPAGTAGSYDVRARVSNVDGKHPDSVTLKLIVR